MKKQIVLLCLMAFLLTPSSVVVPGVMTARIVQGKSISIQTHVVTQYSVAARYNVIGLLAHNTLAGAEFNQMRVGMRVYVMTGGRVEVFRVSEIRRYQALDLHRFMDLTTGKRLTDVELFRLVYMGERHVTFQTCIANGKDLAWGRLFVIAVPDLEGVIR